MDGGGPDAILFQLLGQPIGTVLGPGKHQGLTPVACLDQMGQQFPLATLVHRMDLLVHQFRRGIAGGHVDRLGIVEQSCGQLADLIGKGGREQQVLTPLGQQGQYPADIVDKAHIQHPVGLVQDQHLHPG